jgi:hypothetical protein
MDLGDVAYFLWGLSWVVFWAAVGSLLGTAIILTPWPIKAVFVLLFASLALALAARAAHAWWLYR